MRYHFLLLAGLILTAMPACEEAPRSGPLPLKAVILLDVEGMQGGRNLWLSEDGVGVVQVIGPAGSGGLPEKRYRVRFGRDAVAEAERLAGAHRFPELKLRLGVGPPGGGHPLVAVLTKAGTRSMSIKRESDPHSDFDPVYEHLLRLGQQLDGAELVYNGAFSWDWHPEGFPSRKEIQDGE
jgi:hypothetical protein